VTEEERKALEEAVREANKQSQQAAATDPRRRGGA
jgi:hypothetical protein